VSKKYENELALECHAASATEASALCGFAVVY
jgi:hypothetical protein